MSALNQFYNNQIIEQIAEIEAIKNKCFHELHEDLDTLINGPGGVIEGQNTNDKLNTRQVLYNLIHELKAV